MLKKSFLLVFLLVVFAMLVTGGCGDVEDEVLSEEEVAEETVEVEEEPLTIVDQMGREVTLDDMPQRIISLSPSNTEVLFALGLEEKVVGVTEYCNYPPQAQEKENIGGFSTPSIEKIVELEPDMVLASTIHREEVPRLEDLGITVMVVESATVAELFTSIALIAEVTGVVAEGDELIDSMQDRIDAVQAVVGDIAEEDKRLVYYEVYSDPLMSAGHDAFITEIIDLAGGVNIFGDIDESYPQISAEVVAERQPEIILYPDYHGTADLMLETMTGRPGWENVPAVLNENIFAVSDDAFARPGPRMVDAMEEAASLFYPELF